jgi:hypothetical protein
VIIKKKREQKEREKMIKKKLNEEEIVFKKKDLDLTKTDNELLMSDFARLYKEKIGSRYR